MSQSIDRLRVLCTEVSKIDLGYPQHESVVPSPLPPNAVRSMLAHAELTDVEFLSDFYSLCNGIQFIGARNGYWVDSLERLVNAAEREFSVFTIRLNEDMPVIPLGSTGGGDLFAIHRNLGHVYFLPAGRIEDHCYHGEGSFMRVVASNLPDLLERLCADVDAFVREDGNHRYIDQR